MTCRLSSFAAEIHSVVRGCSYNAFSWIPQRKIVGLHSNLWHKCFNADCDVTSVGATVVWMEMREAAILFRMNGNARAVVGWWKKLVPLSTSVNLFVSQLRIICFPKAWQKQFSYQPMVKSHARVADEQMTQRLKLSTVSATAEACSEFA